MDSWGGKGDGSIAASRHPSWEDDEDGGGVVWSSAGSQGSGSSFNSGGWSQSHAGKRGNIKVRNGVTFLEQNYFLSFAYLFFHFVFYCFPTLIGTKTLSTIFSKYNQS